MWNYLFEYRGFVPEQVVETVFGSRPTKVKTDDITRDLLDQNGPLLVTSFRVTPDSDFHQGRKSSFTKDDIAKDVPAAGNKAPGDSGHWFHAMLLIGVLTHDDGTRSFLLQNWWKSMPFVMVDQLYWEHCCGAAMILPKPSSSVEYCTIRASYTETCADAPVCATPP